MKLHENRPRHPERRPSTGRCGSLHPRSRQSPRAQVAIKLPSSLKQGPAAVAQDRPRRRLSMHLSGVPKGATRWGPSPGFLSSRMRDLYHNHSYHILHAMLPASTAATSISPTPASPMKCLSPPVTSNTSPIGSASKASGSPTSSTPSVAASLKPKTNGRPSPLHPLLLHQRMRDSRPNPFSPPARSPRPPDEWH